MIYERECVNCHGMKGNLGLSGSSDLSKSSLSQNEVINFIMEGKNAMLAYDKKLNPKEINAVARFTETLRE